MSDKYILAIDQGTTSTRAVIFNHDAEIITSSQLEFKQIYPDSGWVEHDPETIWRSTISVIEEVLSPAYISLNEIGAIGITNQRETTLVWDKNTGEPVYNAIVWQCRRTADICQHLKKQGFEETFKTKTGLVLDPYFAGTKIKWILDNVEGSRNKAEKGELVFGTVDSWLIWKLTGGSTHVTDYTNASRTLLFNIHNLKWDQELLDIMDIPAAMLPEVKSSSELYGETDIEVIGARIPIAGIAGDQQAAAFAQCCFARGSAKITYGTGAFMLMNTGHETVSSENGLLTTIAWGLNDEIVYALEGSIFNAGAAVQWLRDEMGLIDEAEDSEYFARKVEDTDGVYFVPAFTGLGAPYWAAEARGVIVGLNRNSNRNHIIRATLESIVYQSQDLIEVMVEDSGIDVKDIRVDGGAAANDFLLQFLADISGTRVERPLNIETTAAGSAFLAGLATNFWSSIEELKKKRQVERIFSSSISGDRKAKLLKGWKKAINTALNWG